MSDRIQEIAERANVPEAFVRQLVAAGALPGEDGELGSRGIVRRARLLWSWTATGLSVETVLALINKGSLSLPSWMRRRWTCPNAWTAPASSSPPSAKCR